ncbi:MAG: hypothetical protein HY691_04260 [Chloroflexi bacterium]|nr:hypothetical protein [Chloroflexota bacterium]
MEVAVQVGIAVVWWIALAGALALTLVAIAEIVRILHHAREIDRLAQVALPAARGIAGNTAAIGDLAAGVESVGRLVAIVETIDRTAAAIERRVRALARGLREPGGA